MFELGNSIMAVAILFNFNPCTFPYEEPLARCGGFHCKSVSDITEKLVGPDHELVVSQLENCSAIIILSEVEISPKVKEDQRCVIKFFLNNFTSHHSDRL